MRKPGYFLSCALCMVMLIGFSTIDVNDSYSADNPVYIGEYCWDAEGSFLRIGITHMGDGHFIGCGTASSEGLEWNINGNLEVIGSNVVITFVDAMTFPGGMGMMSRVGDATLDISTLDGPANTLEMRWEGGEPFLDLSTMYLISVDCDQNPSPDGVDKREELKKILRKYATMPEK